jgi:RNA polymerase sigma factor (TIGR02999 family)
MSGRSPFDLSCAGPASAAELLPLVYGELRALAKNRLSREKPGQTLQPTALVHQAFIRLVDVQNAQLWDSRGHFFAAAAEAMQRILIENARYKKTQKRGGEWQRLELEDVAIRASASIDDLLALGEALELLADDDATAANVARLRLLGGFTLEEVALALDMPPTSVFRQWAYARAFLQRRLSTPPQLANLH